MLSRRLTLVLAFVVGVVRAPHPGPPAPFEPPEYFSPPFKTATAHVPPHAFQSPLDFDIATSKPTWLDYIQQQKTGIRAVHLGKYPHVSNPVPAYRVKKPMIVLRVLSPDASSAHRPQYRIWAQFISSDMPCGWKGDMFNRVMSVANWILPPKCQLPIPTPHPLRVKYNNVLFDDVGYQTSPASRQSYRRMRAMHRIGDYLPSFEMTSREPSPFAATQLPNNVRQDRIKVVLPVTPAYPKLEEANQWCSRDLRVECYSFQVLSPISGSDVFVILENKEPHVQLVEVMSFWIELEPQPTSLVVALPREGPSNRNDAEIAPLQASPANSQAASPPIETRQNNDDGDRLEQPRGLRRIPNSRDLSVENLVANSNRVRKKSPRKSPRRSKSLPAASPWATSPRQDHHCPVDVRRLRLLPNNFPITSLQSSTFDASGDSAITLRRWHQDVRGRENVMLGLYPSLLERLADGIASGRGRDQSCQTEDEDFSSLSHAGAGVYSHRRVASHSELRPTEISSDEDRGQQPSPHSSPYQSLHIPTRDPSSSTSGGEGQQTEEVINGHDSSHQSSSIADDQPLSPAERTFSPGSSSRAGEEGALLIREDDHDGQAPPHMLLNGAATSDQYAVTSEAEHRQSEEADTNRGHSGEGKEATSDLPSSSQRFSEPPNEVEQGAKEGSEGSEEGFKTPPDLEKDLGYNSASE